MKTLNINGIEKTVGIDVFEVEDIDEFNKEQELDYKIAVMQSYKDGCKIEYHDGEEWEEVDEYGPVWDWQQTDYRAVPKQKEPQYRPYTFEEFCKMEMMGKGVKRKDNGNIGYISQYYTRIMDIEINHFNWTNSGGFFGLLKNYTWLDGSPCGVEI